MLDVLVEAVNAALERGDWAAVVELTVPLYEEVLNAGEAQLAELVQDVHWIANDALAHPIEVTHLIAEVRDE
jgi:hypothetical protein